MAGAGAWLRIFHEETGKGSDREEMGKRQLGRGRGGVPNTVPGERETFVRTDLSALLEIRAESPKRS